MTEFFVQIKPLASFHLGLDGELSESDDRIRSDTIWSALFTAALEKGQKELAEKLKEPGAFLISSSFPVWGKVRFLPRPFLRPVEEEGEFEEAIEPAKGKKWWHDVAFVSEAVFRRMVKEQPVGQKKKIGRNCLCLADEIADNKALAWLLATDTATGNVVDRLTSMADLFDRTDLRVNVEAGARLGFRLRLAEQIQDQVEKLFAELGRRGIGGERSSGKGAFEVENISEIPTQEWPKSGRRFVTLSLYHPTEAEVKAGVLEDAAYELITRGGFIDRRGVQRQRVRMLKEGSVLPALDGQVKGDIVDVTPTGFPHPVYRYGWAYPLYLEDGQ